MPVISSSSGNKDGTSDDVEEMKARRTPEHMKGHRSDPLEPASTQMSDWHFLDTNEYEPVTIPPDVPPTRRPKLLGRLLRFGNQSPSTSTSASQFLGRILGGSREGSAVPAGPTSSPPALSKTSSSPRSSHSDPPPTIVPRIPFDDGYTSEDAVVGGSEMHSETRIIKYTSTTDLEGSSTDHLAPGPSNFQVTAKRPAFQPEQKTSIVVHNQFYGGTGGTGGSGLRGRGGDGGVGEGPTVNYHMEAGANLNHIQRDGEPGLHILYRASAGDATHDSEDRFPQPRCHPETRTKLLDVLLNWAKGIEPSNWKFDHDEGEDGSSSSEYTSPDKPFSPILWLHGPAGAGKSAVAQSLCQILEEEGRLGASFFFKRGHPSRGHAKRLFVTIAYQLACHLPDLNRHISQNVENNPSLVDKSLSIQIQKLIVEPCRETSSTPAVVVVLDGLDECDDRNIQQEILRLLGYAVHEQQLPLRFLVASRPEPHIREMFSGTLNGIHRPVNVEQSFEDVQKYLLDEFTRVHREHHETMAMVPLPWPPAETVENLVDKSSGYFIYASTVIRFIDDKDFRPTERLQVITGIQEPHPGSGSPFAALDALYIQILRAVPHRPDLFKILAVIARTNLGLPMSYIDQLLELQPGEVQLVLRGLQSVIGAKKGGTECSDWSIQDDLQSDIVIHHASFLDFLQDPERAGIFYVGSSSLQTELCQHILKALSYSYDNPSWNRHGFVGHYLEMQDAIRCIASSTPSMDLLALLHSLNPDLLLGRRDAEHNIDIVLGWLKLKQSQPLPEDLIHLWEDYRFMIYCEGIWYRIFPVTSQQDQESSVQILSQASPSLIRIFQAMAFRKFLKHPWDTHILQGVHLLLNLSWGELRTAICSLRPLIVSESDMERIIMNVFSAALDPAFFPVPFGPILWDLTCGALRLMQQTMQDEVTMVLQLWIRGWSYYLRSCPPSYELLQELRDIKPFSSDAHNIVQWLKTFSQPPLELINYFQGILDKKCDPYRDVRDPDEIENNWTEWCQTFQGYLGFKQ